MVSALKQGSWKSSALLRSSGGDRWMLSPSIVPLEMDLTHSNGFDHRGRNLAFLRVQNSDPSSR
jgi:hypothetical protein